MGRSATFSLVVLAATRSFADDDWRKTDAAFVDAWKSAVSCLSERDVSFGGETYRLIIDWRPMLHRQERDYSAMEYIHRGGPKNMGRRLARAKFPRRPSKIKVTVQTDAKDAKNLSGVAESAIHDVFLIMNIAAPGCCNFYRAKLVAGKIETESSLSNVNFELCILPGTRKRPMAQFVPVKAVVTWYQTVRCGFSQVPSNPTERALFTLLHMAKLDGDVSEVVWFFYAIESLLQTRAGENFGSIVRRLTLLLNLSGGEVPTLKKELRVLCDMRSAIVHGGFEAMHPMKNEILDKRVTAAFNRLVEAIEYAQVLLVISLQKMVVENWSQLKFDEIMVVLRDSALVIPSHSKARRWVAIGNIDGVIVVVFARLGREGISGWQSRIDETLRKVVKRKAS